MHDRTDLHDHCVVDDALLRVDRAEFLDDLEAAVPGRPEHAAPPVTSQRRGRARRTGEQFFAERVVDLYPS
jgi:hypothetical protein